MRIQYTISHLADGEVVSAAPWDITGVRRWSVFPGIWKYDEFQHRVLVPPLVEEPVVQSAPVPDLEPVVGMWEPFFAGTERMCYELSRMESWAANGIDHSLQAKVVGRNCRQAEREGFPDPGDGLKLRNKVV